MRAPSWSSIASRTAASSMALNWAGASSFACLFFLAATRSGGRSRLATTSARQVVEARVGPLSTSARCALMRPPSGYFPRSTGSVDRLPEITSFRLAHPTFECFIGRGQHDVQLPGAKQIANPQHHLVLVQWLCHKVLPSHNDSAAAEQ